MARLVDGLLVCRRAQGPVAERAGYRRGIAENWDPKWADRRQKLVFIGQNIDPLKLRDRLEACLLTPAEIAEGPGEWRRLADPFPLWRERSVVPGIDA